MGCTITSASGVSADEVVLGLAASRKKPLASLTLAELEKLRQVRDVSVFPDGEFGNVPSVPSFQF